VIFDKNLIDPSQSLDQQAIQEFVARSWYSYSTGDPSSLHPSMGETQPTYTGPQPPYDYLNVEGKYSWLKAPRYNNLPMEVGPLARMLVAYTNGHEQVRNLVNELLGALGLSPAALISTLGRVAARAIETNLVVAEMGTWIDQLEINMNSGNLVIHDGSRWDPSTWPSTATGWGTTEAPRGALGHWVSIANGKIEHYQTVVATTWNGSPRDAAGLRGPFEQALIGTPIADPARPVEILRTIHSFDPCMACSVHLVDVKGNQLGMEVTVH
jgi:hydrogenase large subunit